MIEPTCSPEFETPMDLPADSSRGRRASSVQCQRMWRSLVSLEPPTLEGPAARSRPRPTP
jgi:hypothetical protein